MDIDINLIRRCKKYDKSAIVELFRSYERYLYKLCYSYTQNEQDSLDIVQDIYIKIFKNIDKFDETMPFHPWIRKVSVNTCLNFKRSIKTNIYSLNQEIKTEVTIEDTLTSDQCVEEEIENLDLKRRIQAHLKDIPEQYRLMITLRYYEDLSYNEIAELLNKPMGTVKTELYRAKAMLKKRLASVWEG